MAPTTDDAPKTLDFPAIESARQAMVQRYQEAMVHMRAAMDKVLDRAAAEVVEPGATPDRPTASAPAETPKSP